LSTLRQQLETLGDANVARSSAWFFKTGPGEYGEGDRFRGIRVPQLRKLARQHRGLELSSVRRLLASQYHEDRLLSLLILVERYARGTDAERERIYNLYVESLGRVNNWDLVDSSAEHIVGAWLEDRSKQPLYLWARSSSLWERRVAIMASFHYVTQHEFAVTLKLAGLLLKDEEDLIHKAVGWMLREIGNRDRAAEEVFLKRHYRRMPRTMLRYAIEKFPERRRQAYLKGRI
jgi:3-methyladenine DNA glycosylase AlkD